MSKQTLSSEQMLTWVEGCRNIEKLINKRSFLGLLRQSDNNWSKFWCSAAAEPVLGVNNGYYVGYQAISEYYEARHKLTVLKTELIRNTYPELAGKSLEELHGIGSLVMDNLSTQVIEIAGDGKSAKGLWYVNTTEVDLGVSGPEARWQWGRFGIDFINEDGQWKIWHMACAEDINNYMGFPWPYEAPELPVKPEYAVLAEYKLPEPNMPCKLHDSFYKTRPVYPYPAVPQPYATFTDTFSYANVMEAGK